MSLKKKLFAKMHAIAVLVIVASVVEVSSDVFTSMNRIKDMVLNEKNILTRIKQALPQTPDAKNAFLSFYQQRIQDINIRNVTKEMERLNHPNSAYFIIQEFARDYQQLRKSIVESNDQTAIRYIDEVADDNDVRGARLSLLRLQKVFNLETSDMIKGKYLTFHGPALNSTDAYLIGVAAFTEGDLKQCAQWLEAALQLRSSESHLGKRAVGEGDTPGEVGKVGRKQETTGHQMGNTEILGLLGRTLIRLGDHVRAAELYEEAMRQGSNHGDVTTLGQELQHTPAPYKEATTSSLENFHRLCAEQSKTTGLYWDRRLRCRYRSVFVPYYRFNEEIVSNRPYVTLFYDIITDKEAEHVKAHSITKLYRGVVVGPDRQATSNIRTSHVCFIEDKESNVVKSISSKISQLTGLATEHPPEGFFAKKQSSSEPLQVVNYGLGGHYSVHMDPYEHLNADTEHVMLYSGNRMATFLIYLTDVERGGSTAFPRADIVVSPVKRNAVFWYSFTPAGDLDDLTLHAGCPVMVGEKWIINKWILSYGNTFTRRCGLHRGATQLDIDEDMMRGYKPKAKRRARSSKAKH